MREVALLAHVHPDLNDPRMLYLLIAQNVSSPAALRDRATRDPKQLISELLRRAAEGNLVYESNHCALGGESGGPLFHGTTALGLLSGGTDETTCNSSSTGVYHNYYPKVQNVLNERGLRVF